jgi:hypothetical protein
MQVQGIDSSRLTALMTSLAFNDYFAALDWFQWFSVCRFDQARGVDLDQLMH